MKFKHHILIGIIGSILISYLFDLTYIEWLIIFASSILIDIDHYFWYMNETKTINPFKAIKWYIDHQKYSIWKKLSKEEKSKYKRGFYAFHGIEFWLILILLSFWNNVAHCSGCFLFNLERRVPTSKNFSDICSKKK